MEGKAVRWWRVEFMPLSIGGPLLRLLGAAGLGVVLWWGWTGKGPDTENLGGLDLFFLLLGLLGILDLLALNVCLLVDSFWRRPEA